MEVVKILHAALFLALVGKGSSQCDIEQIAVNQSETGLKVRNTPEWNVIISNPCPCSALELTLSCAGFKSVRDIDPSVLAKSDDECLINNGAPVYRFSTFNFSYVWHTSFPLKPLSFQIACS